jgi:hypothetical protein
VAGAARGAGQGTNSGLEREDEDAMSTSDHPTDDAAHGLHHHPDPEGEYEDKDVGDRVAEPPVGEFKDTDVVAQAPVPEDEGEFPDRDVVSERRHPAAEGSFEDSEIPGEDEDVEAVQVERAHHDHSHDTHYPATGPADPPADPT